MNRFTNPTLLLTAPLIFLLLLTNLYLPAHAGVYRWVDDKGQVHFGEQPPPDVKTESMKPPPRPALPSDQGDLLRSQIQQKQADYTRSRNDSKTAAATAKTEAATRKKNCTQTRQAIASINKYMNKRMLDKDGNYVEESGRQQKLVEARKSEKYWCG